LAFGQASDMHAFGEQAQLSAIVNNWGDYYIERTQQALDGKWKKGDVWGGFSAGMVRMAPFTNMPDNVAKVAQETVNKIKSGELHPFAGPVKDQSGKTRIAAGKNPEDGELLGMNWYVEGVEGDLR